MKITKENKFNHGITLIALIVTIIVLLILARNINYNLNFWKWFNITIKNSKGKNWNRRNKRRSWSSHCRWIIKKINKKSSWPNKSRIIEQN